ncbi:uncharacterized protein N7459_006414 [Penicillium hispanicum]|uniref:uncharacterized protein n=1 Tax=Penicillium hispanicum TaxID=1080232 RepID=UPI002540DDE8|nr:uncharacterized protein N7459_006414 [Penicillium hispanicum]KAJ5577450.1 hypothetical protein N7459_006414 [Penicillium hispanicum]
MSYADAAAKGPKQSPEDWLISAPCLLVYILIPRLSRAPNVGGVYKDESESTTSLIDVDSGHVNTVDSDFLSQGIKTTTQAERIEHEAAEAEQKRARDETAKKAKARKAKSSGLAANSDNPVYIGNAVLYTLLGAGVGFGAYRKHAEGKLSWELVGLWSGAVGALGAVDYFVSKWFLQNKYPPK